MKLKLCLISLILCLCSFGFCDAKYLENSNVKRTGVFWHLTDIHVDLNYSRTGNPHDLCHAKKGKVYPDNGLYGNFLCDSPQLLINATLEAMDKIEKNPDFIIWTGDNLPHTITFDPDWSIIYEAFNNISSLLEEKFPGIPFYPCIGNHDTFPPNILLPNNSTKSIYENILTEGGWNKYLNEESISTFAAGGYYSQVLKPGLRIISLNTILWYTPNNFTQKMKDPLNQFKWMREVLEDCRRSSQMAYIIGHVPPGFYNRVKFGEKSSPTYHSHFLESYLKILMQYSEIIKGQMFGHLHMDMFQLFQSDAGCFLSSSILASSVTPWHFISSDNVSLPVNPSVRLVHFSYEDGLLLDYYQYFLNLSKANTLNGTQDSSKFEVLYSFTEAYEVPDLSTKSLVEVYEKMKNDNDLFEKFFAFSTAGKKSVVCDANCKVAQLCSISSTAIKTYDACMEKNISKYSGFLYYIISIIILIVFCALPCFLCKNCCKKYSRL